jgi:branched-subunit amino acid transport protein
VTIWVAIAAIAVISCSFKAVGPAVLGDRSLPTPVQGVVAVLAPTLLAALLVTELLGAHWTDLDPAILLGVGTAGAARLLRAPMLLALALGAAAAALIRVLG